MRIILLSFCFFIPIIVAGQTRADTMHSYIPTIYGDRLKIFLDSLKIQILADTAKYHPADLVFTASGRQNIKPYSKLYIINAAYAYKLDIVKGPEVKEFVNEMVDEKKIYLLSTSNQTR